MNSKEKLTSIISTAIAKIAIGFISSLFIWWGWNIFAWHFNLPQFSYIEVFAMCMALNHLTSILWQKTLNKEEE